MLGAEIDSDFFFFSIICGTRLLTFSRKGLGVAVASAPPRSSGRFKNGMGSVSMECLATVQSFIAERFVNWIFTRRFILTQQLHFNRLV